VGVGLGGRGQRSEDRFCRASASLAA
jgi:hypothetical protein